MLLVLNSCSHAASSFLCFGLGDCAHTLKRWLECSVLVSVFIIEFHHFCFLITIAWFKKP